MDLANSYNAAGAVQRKLGDYAGAYASHRAELELKQRLVARDPPNQVYKTRLATPTRSSRRWTSRLARSTKPHREAQRSRDLFAALASADTSNPDRRRFLGTAHRIAGVAALERGRHADAVAAFSASRALLDPQLAKTPNNAVWQLALARTLTVSSNRALPWATRARLWPMHAAPLRSRSPWSRSDLPTRRPAA
jgi:hypothetical protein